ncbi:MAG: AmmeMemoRadiSam system protein B [Candidatus Marinimicrobia bacterium]|nr:AmmeMemoRadiSam system protein B [Candidatus Neomarinimicrobiota bacterium]MCF7839570.1 AmmeMemoRadiSam system protein B [Candidatus Neomarinimicrobiota bacterium]MCF7903156.1 AmmeMemoRadiSam system protein B [Candidatus Neomarinimicrobiota bacterium]
MKSNQVFRQARVAGSFYPADPHDIQAMFHQWTANALSFTNTGKLRALIAPHAGYVYSGPIAYNGYHLLNPDEFDTVILIGPSHFDGFEGVSVYPGRGYSTPLGNIPIDTHIVETLSKSTWVEATVLGHGQEHALEVQLPFLQHFLGRDFHLVPLVMGEQTLSMAQKLAEVIKPVLNKRTLLVASSDLSHYHSYDTANILDQKFAEALKSGDTERLWQGIRNREFEACGYGPVMTILEATADLPGKREIEILDRRNSGDTAGDRAQVVGYLAAGIFVN